MYMVSKRDHTCFGTSKLLWVFISAPVGVRDRVNVVRKRCIPADRLRRASRGLVVSGLHNAPSTSFSFHFATLDLASITKELNKKHFNRLRQSFSSHHIENQ